MTLGTLVCMPFSGVLASEIGWESVFYVQGGLSLLWYILWLIFIFDTPEDHPRINPDEKKYIMESFGETTEHDHHKVQLPSLARLRSLLDFFPSVTFC